MILYNVTVSLDEGIHQEWLDWMKTKHIPDVMSTGCFIESRLSRVHEEELGGITYAISYISPSMEKYDEYVERHSAPLQKEHGDMFNGKFAAFRTILTVLEEFKA